LIITWSPGFFVPEPLVTIFSYAFLAIVPVIIAARSVVKAKPNERVVVFRLGQFHAVHPAGLSLVIPFLDKVVKIRIEQIAGWQMLSEPELLESLNDIQI
jgi:regulator of protease activity HflC (stomatin/prohibitin superfamily)